MDKNPTKRFSDRVKNYVKSRPTYPTQVLQVLQRDTGLTSMSIVADIGSGTGISTQLFLQNGNQVYAVEPNAEMRLAAERNLSRYPGFYSVDAIAEKTALASQSVDYVVAAQAFHWFDRSATHPEFRRILRPRGWVVLVWNTRCIDTTPFLRGYEEILQRYGTDYKEIRHRNIEHSILLSFLGESMQCYRFPNHQLLDYEGLKGRLQSSSYTPNESHPSFQNMMDELEQVFRQYAVNDRVSFDYETELYLAQWQHYD